MLHLLLMLLLGLNVLQLGLMLTKHLLLLILQLREKLKLLWRKWLAKLLLPKLLLLRLLLRRRMLRMRPPGFSAMLKLSGRPVRSNGGDGSTTCAVCHGHLSSTRFSGLN